MSKVTDILAVIKTRCEAIAIDSGFQTDMGRDVRLDEKTIDESEVTERGIISIFDTAEENMDANEVIGYDYTNDLEITVEAHIRIGDRAPLQVRHDAISDIKTAVLISSDRILGGLVLDIQYIGREAPDTSAAGSDIASVKLTFSTQYTEIYGSP